MSTETTKKKIKIDNGTEFARVYTDKEVDSKLTNKQDTLVSGTNIKTLNGQSILGSGDLPISGGSGGAGNKYLHCIQLKMNDLELYVSLQTNDATKITTIQQFKSLIYGNTDFDGGIIMASGIFYYLDIPYMISGCKMRGEELRIYYYEQTYTKNSEGAITDITIGVGNSGNNIISWWKNTIYPAIYDIIEDKRNGFILPKSEIGYDAKRMSEMMESIMMDNEKWEQLSKEAIKRSSLFSLENIYKQWYKNLTKLNRG